MHSGEIGFNNFSSNVLIAVSYVQGWIWQFKVLAENSVVRKAGILSYDIKGFPNNVTRKPGKQGA
jgi:hypothetical protein